MNFVLIFLKVTWKQNLKTNKQKKNNNKNNKYLKGRNKIKVLYAEQTTHSWRNWLLDTFDAGILIGCCPKVIPGSTPVG